MTDFEDAISEFRARFRVAACSSLTVLQCAGFSPWHRVPRGYVRRPCASAPTASLGVPSRFA